MAESSDQNLCMGSTELRLQVIRRKVCYELIEASIISKVIPGFGSYVSEQKRRDDDLTLRRYLIDRLQGSKKILQAKSVGLVDKALFGAIKESKT